MRLGVLLAMLLPVSACAGYHSLTYTAESIEAKVIDAETKQPLEGVVVVAHWELERGTMGGNVPAGQLMVMEAVTDREGKFSFPGWGPKTVRDSFLVDKDPRLLFFKSGYRYLALRNEYNSSRELRTHLIRRSEWRGKSIEMKPFKGMGEKYVEYFKDFNRELDLIISRKPEDCEWKKIPRTITAMLRERKVLEDSGIRYAFSIDQQLLISDEYFTKKGGIECGSPKEFIKGLER